MTTKPDGRMPPRGANGRPIPRAAGEQLEV
jgi:hypothetical protein